MPTDSTMWRGVRATALVFAICGCATVRPIDRARWTGDLDSLLVHMPRGYANLEYAVRVQRLDVAALATQARERIARGRTERAGRAAIGDFLAAFGDLHVSLGAAPPKRNGGTSGERSYRSCKDLGFRGRDRRFHKALREQPGFEEDHGSAFPMARVRLANGAEARAVRIPLFSQSHLPDVCEALWPRFANAEGDCGDACVHALRKAVGDSALADLGKRLGATAPADSALLVVDITGNGGGSEWAREIAQRLTDKTLMRPAVGMVRHEHWRTELERRRAEAKTPSARVRAESLLAALATQCDWSGIWNGMPAPACSPVVIEPALPSVRHEAPVWRGRLLLLVDGRTASASEEFAAMLVDGGVARVAGARTMGIGCGFTNGGIDFRLPRSGLLVRLPDCARFRRDGANERAGILPDVGLWTAEESDAEKVRKTSAALSAASRRSTQAGVP